MEKCFHSLIYLTFDHIVTLYLLCKNKIKLLQQQATRIYVQGDVQHTLRTKLIYQNEGTYLSKQNDGCHI